MTCFLNHSSMPTWNTSVHTTAFSPPCNTEGHKLNIRIVNQGHRTVCTPRKLADTDSRPTAVDWIFYRPVCSKVCRRRLLWWFHPIDSIRQLGNSKNMTQFDWVTNSFLLSTSYSSWGSIDEAERWKTVTYPDSRPALGRRWRFLWTGSANKQAVIASTAPKLLCNLALRWSLTYRLDDEEQCAQQTGDSAKSQLQILFDRADNKTCASGWNICIVIWQQFDLYDFGLDFPAL